MKKGEKKNCVCNHPGAFTSFAWTQTCDEDRGLPHDVTDATFIIPQKWVLSLPKFIIRKGELEWQNSLHELEVWERERISNAWTKKAITFEEALCAEVSCPMMGTPDPGLIRNTEIDSLVNERTFTGSSSSVHSIGYLDRMQSMIAADRKLVIQETLMSLQAGGDHAAMAWTYALADPSAQVPNDVFIRDSIALTDLANAFERSQSARRESLTGSPSPSLTPVSSPSQVAAGGGGGGGVERGNTLSYKLVDMDFNDIEKWNTFLTPERLGNGELDMVVVDYSVTKFFNSKWKVYTGKEPHIRSNSASIVAAIASHMSPGAKFYSYCCEKGGGFLDEHTRRSFKFYGAGFASYEENEETEIRKENSNGEKEGMYPLALGGDKTVHIKKQTVLVDRIKRSLPGLGFTKDVNFHQDKTTYDEVYPLRRHSRNIKYDFVGEASPFPMYFFEATKKGGMPKISEPDVPCNVVVIGAEPSEPQVINDLNLSSLPRGCGETRPVVVHCVSLKGT